MLLLFFLDLLFLLNDGIALQLRMTFIPLDDMAVVVGAASAAFAWAWEQVRGERKQI